MSYLYHYSIHSSVTLPCVRHALGLKSRHNWDLHAHSHLAQSTVTSVGWSLIRYSKYYQCSDVTEQWSAPNGMLLGPETTINAAGFGYALLCQVPLDSNAAQSLHKREGELSRTLTMEHVSILGLMKQSRHLSFLSCIKLALVQLEGFAATV